METLSIYIPMDRRQAMMRGESLPDRSHGAALMADVSGFTPLTEVLARELGPQRGAEEIMHYLNQVYDALIAEVDRYQGSVIGFSGDAITCWFDGDDGLRAATCAVQLQRAMEQFSRIVLPSGAAVTLAMKAVVATGPIRRFVVGDPNVQLIDVLAGATLDRLAAAEHQARKGEVVLSAETADRLQQQAVIAEWRADAAGGQFAVLQHLGSPAAPQPWPEFDPTPDLDQQVKQWLLAEVYARESSGQGAFLAELRPAVAIFVRFSGIDYDGDAAAGQKLDEYVRWVQGVLNRYEGFLLQLTIGDKGSYLYAAFGAPLAHDDDAARSMAAAQTLRTLPRDLHCVTGVQIGVSQGRMRVGPYGSLLRRTYGVLGDEANVAARLMQLAAPGQVIVTKRVAEQAAQRFRFRSLGGVTVKGKLEPIPIFELTEKQLDPFEAGDQEKGSAPPPLVIGRADERTILTARLWKLLTTQASGLVVVSGEAGIGKTRLIEDLRAEARILAVTTLNGAGDAIEKSTPYHAWRSVFNRCLKLDNLPDDLDARRKYVLTELESDPEALRVAPLLNAVLPLDIPDNDLTAQMTGQVRADNTHALLIRLLQHLAASEPLLLLLEDAHWLDSASWALALAVSHTVQPLLMVISTRPLSDPLPADYQQLLDNPDLVQISLDSMQADEISHLICHRLGAKALPEQVHRLILQKAEGNPFFSEELAFALRDTGLITITGGECRIAPNVDFKAMTFPDTVQGVITSRIDRLTPSQQMTLKAASVVGRVFAYRILRDIHPIVSDRPQLQQYLDTLQRLDLTVLETPEPDLAYLFKHAITQEVTYNLMLFAQRRDLHRAVAEWYERTYADNLSPYYSVLAYHWQRAAADEQTDPTVSAKAIEYLEKAGGQAMRSYANQEALAYFQDLFQLADAQPTVAVSSLQRGRWEGELAEAYLGLGELAESREHFHRALTLLGHPPPVKPLALTADMLKHIVLQTAHRIWPARFVGRGRNQREALLEAAHLCQQVSKIYFYFTESFLLLNANLRALNWSEAAGPSGVLAQTYASMCAIAGLLSQHRLAVQYGRLAQVTSQQINDQPAAGWVFLATGLYYCGIGSWTESQSLLEQALATFALLGDRRQWEESCSVIAPTYYYQGELKISAEYRSRAYASAHERGDHQVQVWGAVGQAVCLIRLGQMDQALSLLELVRPLLGEGEDTVWAYGALALAYWRNGDHQHAREAAEAGARRLNKFRPTAAQVLEGYVDLAEVYLAMWEHADARDTTIQGSVKQALRALQSFAKTFPIGRPSLLRLQGLYARLTGNPAQARQLWQTSLAEAERLSMPYEQALTHYEIGRWTSGGDRQQELNRAQELFEQLGAAYDAARVHDLLDGDQDAATGVSDVSNSERRRSPSAMPE